jgi:phospholipase/lecithinase/hemolysin
MDVRKRIRCAFAALVFAFASNSVSAGYTSLIVFGDSLLDNGNALLYNLGTPGLGAALGYLVPTDLNLPPYPAGATQYTAPGGKSAVEVLAQRLGLPPLGPSQLGGNNFATGGATTGTLNFVGDGALVPNPSPFPGVLPGTPFYPGLAGIGIRTEVAQFATRLAGSPADPGALYVVMGGPNDIFLNAALSKPQDPVASVSNVVAAIGDLYALGARIILVPNLPDIGKAPGFLGGPSAAGVTALTLAFNALLASAIPNLESSFAGLDILPFDTLGAFNDLLANAASLGFTDTTHACYLLGSACDPAQFVFWDMDHPTPRVQAILGNQFFAAVVPEPGTIALVALGLFILLAGRHAQYALRLISNLGSS